MASSQTTSGEARKRSTDRSRRGFLRRALTAGGGLGLATTLLAGCRGGDDERTRPDTGVQTPTGEEAAPGLSEEVAECRSTEQLSPQDLKVRQALGYTPDSPEEGERCANCRFYTTPESNDGPCGGCTLFPGPVVAGGWCTSWVAQRS